MASKLRQREASLREQCNALKLVIAEIHQERENGVPLPLRTVPARKSITEPGLYVHDAMNAFLNFASEAKQIWSHATFDFVIVQETLKALRLPPLSYKAARDIRTLVDLSGVQYKKRPRPGVHHDALHDCVFQVGYCVEAFKQLQRKEI